MTLTVGQLRAAILYADDRAKVSLVIDTDVADNHDGGISEADAEKAQLYNAGDDPENQFVTISSMPEDE